MTDVLAERIRTSPTATALVVDPHEWSYAELDTMAERFAGRLSALGLEAGDHLGVLVETRPAAVGLIHAAARLGCVLVAFNARLTSAELDAQTERTDLTALICATDTEETAVDIADDLPVVSVDESNDPAVTEFRNIEPTDFEPSPRTADDPALLLATSGTTGEPKLVVLTRENLRSSAVASAFRLGISPDDRWLDPLSVYHMGGFAPIFRSALYGTTVVLPRGGFDPETTLAALAKHDCTGISLVPTMLRRLLDAGSLPDSLRFVLLGGAPTPPELVERCARRNVPVHPTYGMTETASQVATARPAEAFANTDTVGRPLYGTRVSILDGAGDSVETGETGELVISGPTVFAGYYDDPDATAAAFSERGFHTGDVGHRDDAGRLWVTGRLDDQISTGGELVDPGEVVAVLRAHPAIVDAAVVGLSDPEWGERVGALVVADGGIDRDGLEIHCRERLAGFKLPRTMAFADSLPRTASGTVERDGVREYLREHGE